MTPLWRMARKLADNDGTRKKSQKNSVPRIVFFFMCAASSATGFLPKPYRFPDRAKLDVSASLVHVLANHNLPQCNASV